MANKKRIRTSVSLPNKVIDQHDLQFRFTTQGWPLGNDATYLWCHEGDVFGLEAHQMGKNFSYLFEQTDSPHEFLSSTITLQRLADKYHRVDLGILATDFVRRPPATLAQDMNSIAHFTKRKVTVFVGRGEAMNINLPDKPYEVLERGLPILRQCLTGPKGRFDHQHNGVEVVNNLHMDLRPPEGKVVELGIAGSGKRGARLAGEWADAFCPVMIDISVDKYQMLADHLDHHAGLKKRDSGKIRLCGQFYFVFADKQSQRDDLLEHPMLKYNALMFSAETWAKHTSVKHPFGTDFGGFHDFHPESIPPGSLKSALSQVPIDLYPKVNYIGSVDGAYRWLEPYLEVGCTEVVSQTPAALINKLEGVKQLLQLRQLHREIKKF